ncbi:MAG: type II toxin-antitoxin system VapC family toxin [Bryobacteraceae bacterium]
MRLVLDASAALEVVLKRSRAGDFIRAIQDADTVMAPELLVPEVVNAIWKYHQFDRLDLNTCNQALELAIELADDLVSCKDLWREAFLLARKNRRPAYDMFYIALARREDAAILTMDKALRKEAERVGVQAV